MRALKSKVAKMEQTRRSRAVADKSESRRIRQVLCGCIARELPGLDRVRPEHTDPETYRDIQEMLAWARGDYVAAERLAALDPDKHVPPPPGAPLEKKLWLAQDALDRSLEDARVSTEQVKAAIETASSA